MLYKYILMVLDDGDTAFAVGWRGVKRRGVLCSRRVIFVRRVVRVVALGVSLPPLIIVMTRRAAAASRLVFDKMTRDVHYGQTIRPLQRAREVTART